MKTLNGCQIGLALTAATFVGLVSSQPAHALSFSLTDLSELGVPAPDLYSYPHRLNDLGQVAGSYTVTEGQEKAFFWDKNTGRIDIGTLSEVTDFNNLGQVIGNDLFWNLNTGLVDIGNLVGGNTYLNELNNLGQVIGNSYTSDGKNLAFFWDQNTGIIDLTTLGGSGTSVSDINDKGQVLGGSLSANGKINPFIWDKTNGITRLGDPGIDDDAYLLLGDINNSGQVTALTGFPTFMREKILYWDKDSGFIDTGMIRYEDYFSYGMNDLGQIFNNDIDSNHSYYWQKGVGIVDIGTLGGSYTIFSDFNNLGQVVGQSETESEEPRAFYWDKSSGMIDLDRVLSSFGWKLEYPNSDDRIIINFDINDAGQILGTGIYNGERRAFLLTPDSSPSKSVPEPATALGVLAFGAFAAAFGAKRQQQK